MRPTLANDGAWHHVVFEPTPGTFRTGTVGDASVEEWSGAASS